MKVYIVTDGDYSDYHIEAVFTDKKQAEIYAALHSCNDIEEWETDETKIEGEVEAWVIHKFGVWSKGVFFDGSHYSDRKYTDVRRSISGVSIYVALKEYDRDRATKIAEDMYAKYLYERSENGKS